MDKNHGDVEWRRVYERDENDVSFRAIRPDTPTTKPETSFPTGTLTGSLRYGRRREPILVGFGHKPYPADYRTETMVDRDRDLNIRAIDEQ